MMDGPDRVQDRHDENLDKLIKALESFKTNFINCYTEEEHETFMREIKGYYPGDRRYSYQLPTLESLRLRQYLQDAGTIKNMKHEIVNHLRLYQADKIEQYERDWERDVQDFINKIANAKK